MCVYVCVFLYVFLPFAKNFDVSYGQIMFVCLGQEKPNQKFVHISHRFLLENI